ncbi:MAG: glycosyltransferase family 9 protein [Patescibacteria group bacterium]|mgnify:CR=1 FL=1
MNYLLRMRNILLFILAIFSIVFYGNRKKINKTPKKILIIQLAKLGDMVCMTPVFHALRQNVPQTKIYVMGDGTNKELLKGNNDIDEYLVFQHGRLFSMVKQLRREKINVACIRGTGFVPLVVALLAGIPLIITPKVTKGKALQTKTYELLLPYVKTVDFRFGEYMPRQFLRLLEPLGIVSSDTKKYLVFSDTALEKTNQFLKRNGIESEKYLVVGISPSAGNKIKEWPEERFAEVADYLIQKHNAKVLLIGGPHDDQKVKKLIKNIKNIAGVVNTQGEFNVDELKALVSKLDLFISVDTGPIYIAEAFGVPTIDIIGPVDEKEQPPISNIHRIVYWKDRKAPAVHILNTRIYDAYEARKQIESISAKDVISTFEELIRDSEFRRFVC